jgi:hypothetical protein
MDTPAPSRRPAREIRHPRQPRQAHIIHALQAGDHGIEEGTEDARVRVLERAPEGHFIEPLRFWDGRECEDDRPVE